MIRKLTTLAFRVCNVSKIWTGRTAQLLTPSNVEGCWLGLRELVEGARHPTNKVAVNKLPRALIARSALAKKT